MTLLFINWNPSDTLINLGPLPIKYYSLMFVVAFLGGLQIMKRIFKNENISEEKLDTLFIYAVVSILVGARLGHVFFYDWDYYQNNLLEIILPFRLDPFKFTGIAGLASHGAAIGVIIAMYLYHKKYPEIKLSWILDRVVLPVAFGAIFVRLGNLMNSEIIGKVTNSDYGFRFIQQHYRSYEAIQLTKAKTAQKAYDAIVNNPKFSALLEAVPLRHPAQLYESICYIFVFAILMYTYWKTDKKQKPFYIFGLFLVLLWSVRFIVEFYKKSQGGFEDSLGNLLSTGQWLSIPFIIIGLYFMFRPAPKTK
jgi:prolipoprotein diacylglyceryl transferase|tara:strand:+ start:443 stop:1366 length:924 start_codon:yes stop_codon:yes gene_type:complete